MKTSRGQSSDASCCKHPVRNFSLTPTKYILFLESPCSFVSSVRSSSGYHGLIEISFFPRLQQKSPKISHDMMSLTSTVPPSSSPLCMAWMPASITTVLLLGARHLLTNWFGLALKQWVCHYATIGTPYGVPLSHYWHTLGCAIKPLLAHPRVCH